MNVLNNNKVDYSILNSHEINKKFPDLKEYFFKAVLFTNSLRVKSPLKLSESYFNYFIQNKGKFINNTCTELKFNDGQWTVYSNDNIYNFEEVIISTGPWLKKLLSNLGYDIPLAWERGYHHQCSTKKKFL